MVFGPADRHACDLGLVCIGWFGALVGRIAALLVLHGDVIDWRPAAMSARSEWALGLLAISCAALTLVVHRPDMGDDPFFVNLAVGAADRPLEPLLVEDTMYGIEGAPLRGAYYRVHTIEMLAAVIAWTSGVPAIYVSHWRFATLAGLLLPLAYARLLKNLVPNRWMMALIALLVVLLATGGASDG